MPSQFADAAAHRGIPEEFLECLITRRHSIPMRASTAQHVRIQFGDSKTDVLELTEYVGTCERCGCVRTLFRDRYANTFVHADYQRPDGYDPPPGHVWDRAELWTEQHRRHPVTGRVRTVKR